MPLAVKSAVRVQDQACDLCGKVKPSLLRVDEYHGVIVTVCTDWPEKGSSCFHKKYPFDIVECGSSAPVLKGWSNV